MAVMPAEMVINNPAILTLFIYSKPKRFCGSNSGISQFVCENVSRFVRYNTVLEVRVRVCICRTWKNCGELKQAVYKSYLLFIEMPE